MQFIKPDINLEIIGRRKIAFSLSFIMIAVSIGALAVGGGPRFGIDFAGGTLIQVRFDAPVNIEGIKSGLASLGLGSLAIQQFGEEDAHEVLIRTDQAGVTDKGFSEKLRRALAETSGAAAEIRRVEMVGPQVGKDLREKALKAMFYALLFITVYISGRFEMKWALSGVLAAALIGSCTNSRITDLRLAASLIKGRKVADKVRMMVVPGSQQVKQQAEAEGLDKIFKEAGAEWRESGCSMCIAMNGDQLAPGQYAISTSNRNFEGRQGKGGRTHLCSPAMAAAAAITGHFVDIRHWDYQ